MTSPTAEAIPHPQSSMPSPPNILKIILSSASLFHRLNLPVELITRDALKDRFKEIALKVHPDKCKHPEATEAFQLAAEAYEILSNPIHQHQEIRRLLKSPSATLSSKPHHYHSHCDNISRDIYNSNHETTKGGDHRRRRGRHDSPYPSSSASSYSRSHPYTSTTSHSFSGWSSSSSSSSRRQQQDSNDQYPKQYYKERSSDKAARSRSNWEAWSHSSWAEFQRQFEAREAVQENLRRQFLSLQSNKYLQRQLSGLISQAERTVRTLDEQHDVPQHDLWPQEEGEGGEEGKGKTYMSNMLSLAPDLSKDNNYNNALESLPLRLSDIISYLRNEYMYCLYCGSQFPSREEFERGCPGPLKSDHDDDEDDD